MPISETDKPETDKEIERIRSAFTTAFGVADADISKNPRRLLKVGLWELAAAHPADALDDLFVQMQGDDLIMVGLSFSVSVPHDGSASEKGRQKIKFSFTSEPEDPAAVIAGGAVSGSIFHERADGVRFSIGADMSGYSMIDMAGKGKDAFLEALDSSRQCMAYEPGALDARELSSEERAFVIGLARRCLSAAETALVTLADFASIISMKTL